MSTEDGSSKIKLSFSGIPNIDFVIGMKGQEITAAAVITVDHYSNN